MIYDVVPIPNMRFYKSEMNCIRLDTFIAKTTPNGLYVKMECLSAMWSEITIHKVCAIIYITVLCKYNEIVVKNTEEIL